MSCILPLCSICKNLPQNPLLQTRYPMHCRCCSAHNWLCQQSFRVNHALLQGIHFPVRYIQLYLFFILIILLFSITFMPFCHSQGLQAFIILNIYLNPWLRYDFPCLYPFSIWHHLWHHSSCFMFHIPSQLLDVTCDMWHHPSFILIYLSIS